MEAIEDVLMEGLGATREQAEALHQWVFDSFTDADCDQLRMWLSDSYARLYDSYEEYVLPDITSKSMESSHTRIRIAVERKNPDR